MGSLSEAALRQEVEEAKVKLLRGDKPRDVFERVLFEEAREKLQRRRDDR